MHAGYHLLTRMYGDVTYVPRSEYANRQAMFRSHTARVQRNIARSAKVGLRPYMMLISYRQSLVSAGVGVKRNYYLGLLLLEFLNHVSCL
jgi:hypothetical protein